MEDGRDGELNLLYYLFSAHHWGLADLRALWEGETGWYDLIHALSSFEAHRRAEEVKAARSPALRMTKRISRRRRK